MRSITSIIALFLSIILVAANISHQNIILLSARHIHSKARTPEKRCFKRAASPVNIQLNSTTDTRAIINVKSTCGDIRATKEVTTLSGPNGHIDWLNCGFETDGGWQPPYIRIEDIITHPLSNVLNKSSSPFKACSKYLWIFEKYGSQYNIPPILLASFAMQESSCQPDTIGGGGEQGLMQITTEKCVGAPYPGGCRDPEFNIHTATKYFVETLKNNNGDVLLSVGAYNGWHRGLTKREAFAAVNSPCCRCQNNACINFSMAGAKTSILTTTMRASESISTSIDANESTTTQRTIYRDGCRHLVYTIWLSVYLAYLSLCNKHHYSEFFDWIPSDLKKLVSIPGSAIKMGEQSTTSSSSSSDSTPSSSISSPDIQTLQLNRVVSEEDKIEAARLKVHANKAFTSHDFPAAARLYSEAIEKNPDEPTLWCNRAYARMKLEEYGYALSDASQAIALDPTYAKAYYRRAICYVQILKPQSAVSDFRKVLALEPKNETVRSQMVSTQKLIRKIEFEKAIEIEGEKNPVDRCHEIIAEGGCELDANYLGPTLPSENGRYYMTQAFFQAMIDWFKDGKTLPKRYVWEIVLGAHEQFAKEQSLVNLDIQDGVTCDVIGDVHGQLYDVLHLFSLTGPPTEKHYLLMNGDLVDRGSWSIEVILLAFAYKWLYPKYMYINRGNHEAKEMNRTYGFEGEAKHKHGEQSYKLFAHVFTTLPLSTLVSATKPPEYKGDAILSPQGLKRFFVVHGGLFSKDGVTLEDIRQIDRIGRQPGQEGLMCELLWTDPQELPGRGPSKRGVGIAFGPDVTKRWCTLNGVTGIIRSHEVRQNGYAIEHAGLCTTVFSAPNYVDQTGNKGAFIRIDATGDWEFTQFEASPHPPMKPMAYVQGGLGSLMMM